MKSLLTHLLGRKQRTSRARPTLEALEDRDLMAVLPITTIPATPIVLSGTSSFAPDTKWQDWFAPGSETPLVGDFNGDRKDDIVTFTGGSSADAWVALSNGSSFGAATKWQDWFAPSPEVPLVGDFNGDGRDDIATFTRGNTADVWVALSTGPGFTGGMKWHDWFCANDEVPRVGDFNGDGKDDLATFTRGNTADVWVALSTGSGFTGGMKWHDWFCAGTEVPLIGDVNGDRKDDIITFTRGNTGDVWVGLSTGNGFGAGTKWHDSFCYGDEVPLVGDFNSDGKDDIATFTRGSTADVYGALSTGSAFGGDGWKWHESFCSGSEVPVCGDFNGDGDVDLARFTQGTTADVYVARSTIGRATNYAVLFSGGINQASNYTRYYDNIKDMYQTLIQNFYIMPENVTVIYADGTNSAVDRSDNANSDMSYAAGSTVLSASKANLLDTLDTLSSTVDLNDQFFFYSFDHGGGSLNAPGTTGEEVLNGWGEDIRDDELAARLNVLRCTHSTYVFAECYAGGMLDDLALQPGTFGCAATNHYELSYGDDFARAFVNALKNGKTTTRAAFQYAWQNDASAIKSGYTGNSGTYVSGKEHPWWNGDDFSIFARNMVVNSVIETPAAEEETEQPGLVSDLPPLEPGELPAVAAAPVASPPGVSTSVPAAAPAAPETATPRKRRSQARHGRKGALARRLARMHAAAACPVSSAAAR